MARDSITLLVGLALLCFSSLALAGLDPSDLPMVWRLTDGEDKGIGGGFDIVDDLRQPPWVRPSCSLHSISPPLAHGPVALSPSGVVVLSRNALAVFVQIFKYTYNERKNFSFGNQYFTIPDGVSATALHRYVGFSETKCAALFASLASLPSVWLTTRLGRRRRGRTSLSRR